MNFVMRPYKTEEFERACQVRGLVTVDAQERFKIGFLGSGKWINDYLHFALVKNELLVGDIQLRHCDRTMPEGVAHIGIDIAQTEQGKGAGTIALELAWQWAQANNFHRLEGSTDVKNIAMRRAFEKASWIFEGTMKNLFLEDGVGHDYLSFAKTI
ncbi:N-acetyltransferase [Actinobacteria bacterium IMCC26103]|nr:N-acetyltransferase [Actinobacteria bacterium IMCC26103]